MPQQCVPPVQSDVQTLVTQVSQAPQSLVVQQSPVTQASLQQICPAVHSFAHANPPAPSGRQTWHGPPQVPAVTPQAPLSQVATPQPLALGQSAAVQHS
jgi:hypothetical protein